MKFHDLKTSSEDLKLNKERRGNEGKGAIPFGIPFLDASLGGIYKNDLILLGSRSGAGKTEAATIIAESAVAKNKKVAFFSLEAYEGENSDRRLYRRLAQRYFADKNRKKDIYVNFLDWSVAEEEIEKAFQPYFQEEVDKMIAEDNGNYLIRYRTEGDYTIEMFQKEIASLKDFDLIIIDHFHYFDLDAGPEYESQKMLAKQIRDLNQKYKIPIVVIAHLRKKDNYHSTPVPGMEDFMGSSDLFKIATKVILLAPGPRHISRDETGNQWVTYINVAKNRVDGSRTKYMAKTIFDLSTNSYLPSFLLGGFGKEKRGEYVWENLDSSLIPKWAKGETNEVYKSAKMQMFPR